MNHLDSDLEEGEIIDDSPPSPSFNINTRKSLPRRYIVKDNRTPVHKHKKGCRHAVRHHTKKPSKLKKNPARKKNNPKWHNKPSNTHDKSWIPGRCNSSDNFKDILPENSYFSQNSLIAEMKGSLKNSSPLKKISTKLRSQKPPFMKKIRNTFSENYLVASETSNTKMQKKDMYNSVTNSVSDDSDDSIIELSIHSNPSDPPLIIDLCKSPEATPSIVELNYDNDVNNAISNNSLQVKEEESEDEEELRRIALATCANRKTLRQSENIIQNVDYPPVPDLSDANNVQIFHPVTNNSTTDNYEVVDMEVDEEVQDSLETAQTSLVNQKSESAEKLFVIDTNPSNDFLQKKENSISETKAAGNSDDEDFEVSILRAELLNSMHRKNLVQAESKQESNIAIPGKRFNHVVQQKKLLVNYQKPNLQFSYKRLKSAKHFLRKRSVNKLINIKNNNKISVQVPAPAPVPVKPSERLIITVNGESSDDSDEETNTGSENPVDSIVALISDCRQKSESSSETKEKETVPKAVSCLSKAQQEEYNSLMKILAKKKKLPTAQGVHSTKNGSIHTPLDDLKKLEEKLIVFRGALENKKESMKVLSEEVNSKKHYYMKAKLTAQHLKEQLVAAEKVRKAKLIEWSNTCDNLKQMKQSVSDLENRINEVQILCSKIGSSLQGPSSSGNEQS